jgi:hypothetical protein
VKDKYLEKNLPTENLIDASNGSSNTGTISPEVSSRSHDVNKHAGRVIDITNMQMTYLIYKVPT